MGRTGSFSDGGDFIFKWVVGVPMGGIGFGGGVFEKNHKMGGSTTTMGNPALYISFS